MKELKVNLCQRKSPPKPKKRLTPNTKGIFGVGVNWNTHKKFTYPVRESTTSNVASCKCKKIQVDGCEDYVRIDGKEGDYSVIKK